MEGVITMYKVCNQVFWDVVQAEQYAKLLKKLTGKTYNIERV
jgi:hypothetical protein